MKNKNPNSFEPVAEQGYKKKYLQRVQEENETKKELEMWRKTSRDKQQREEDRH